MFSKDGEQPFIEDKETSEPQFEDRSLKIDHIQIEFIKEQNGLVNLLIYLDLLEAMEGLYTRKYKKLMGTLDQAKKNFPGTAIAPMGRALMWQVMMLENFDFKYEKQYKTVFDIAEEEFKEAIKKPGSDAWEQFLLGAFIGVDSIHLLRKEEFFSALSRGF